MDSTIVSENTKWIQEVWTKLDEKLSCTAIKSRYKIPYTTVNGVHDNWIDKDINWWTNGFWGGMMWLMYKGTGNEEYCRTALESEKIMDSALKNYHQLHHDVGFMWHILSGASYRITGNRDSCIRNLYAASVLASRYNIDGRFIRAWNSQDKKVAGWTIIDSLMNIPLLYWASEQTGSDSFKRIAMAHADMAVRDHIREDGSVNHIVEHDTETGAVIKVYGGQGYDENSCWSRGLAWAVYGMTLSYIYTKKKDYLDAAIRTANYFIANCFRTDYLPPIDFRAPDNPIYYDSTAGVCAACGILELSKYVSQAEGKVYTRQAINLLKAADKHFCNYDSAEDSILQMGSEKYPLENNKGVHIPIIYGDFFFVEAMLKLRGEKFLIW